MSDRGSTIQPAPVRCGGRCLPRGPSRPHVADRGPSHSVNQRLPLTTEEGGRMADPPRDAENTPDTGDDSGVTRDHDPPSRTSRWQKVVGILGFVVILWVADDLLDNVLDHGPGGGGGPRHGPTQGEDPAEDQEQHTGPDDGGGHGRPEDDHS